MRKQEILRKWAIGLDYDVGSTTEFSSHWSPLDLSGNLVRERWDVPILKYNKQIEDKEQELRDLKDRYNKNRYKGRESFDLLQNIKRAEFKLSVLKEDRDSLIHQKRTAFDSADEKFKNRRIRNAATILGIGGGLAQLVEGLLGGIRNLLLPAHSLVV